MKKQNYSTGDLFLKVKKLFDVLNNEKLLATVRDNSHYFYDEPKFFHYQALLNISIARRKPISSSGISFTSREEALLKCLSEAIERLSLFYDKDTKIIYNSSDNLVVHKYLVLNLRHYIDNEEIISKKFRWIWGYNETINKKCLIPAQLVYLNDDKKYVEEKLTTRISSGAAGGFSKNTAILRGIYEIIERDSFITTYLNQIRVPHVDLCSLKSPSIRYAVSQIHRYNLDIFTLDLTTDVGIPVFASILVDKTGLGPSVVVGIKSHLNIDEAILGSIQELFGGRAGRRVMMNKNSYELDRVTSDMVIDQESRAKFWNMKHMYKKLSFWLDNNNKKIRYTTVEEHHSVIEQLRKVKDVLAKKNHNIYTSNISMHKFLSVKHYVYKVIIPTLQSSYTNEKDKKINYKRLSEVSKYFGQNTSSINPIPHPFV